MIKINDIEIGFDKFPNGEILIDTKVLNSVENGCRIDFKWENNEDILRLYFVLRHLIARTPSVSDKKLYIYYMPYSRMDRSENDSCFTLRYICDFLISDCMAVRDRIFVVEPHSNKTLDMLDGSCRINAITPLTKKICDIEDIDIICYPDEGAKKRFQDDFIDKPVIYCDKKRDFDTGKIQGLELITNGWDNADLKDKNILVVDDLCSRGGTFYYTAKKLQEYGVNDIFLGVCHMEKTVIDGNLLEEYKNFDDVEPSIIKHIYCFNTMLDECLVEDITQKYKNITIYDIEKFLREGKVRK